MFDEVRVGQTLTISAPRNNFPLNEDAPRTVLIEQYETEPAPT